MRVPKDHSPRLKKFARQLRAESTDAERKIWSHLRDRQLNGLKFRRQVPIHGFIVDFYCEQGKLAIELDGGHHTDPYQAEYDTKRDRVLKSLGIRVLRFTDVEVLRDADAVLNEILNGSDRPSPQPSPGIPGEGVKSVTDRRG